MSKAAASSQPQLLRVLGPVGATAVVVGSVIGSGIFKKAGGIAENVGRVDLVLLVWVVCGILSLLGALAFAELGAMMPQAGGQYVYLREAFGPLSGFLWGWAEFWIMRTGSTAALAVMFAEAFVESLGAAGDSPLKEAWVARGIAITAIAVLSWVNIVGAKSGGLTQNVTTIVKMALLVALMLLPFLTHTAHTSNLSSTLTPSLTPSAGNSTRLALVACFATMSAVFWAYDGWNNIGPVAEEIRNPQRNLPIALFCGMFILIALYLGVTLAYHLVLSMDEVAATNVPGSFVAARACEKMLGTYGGAIASAAVMISTFGALNANLFVGPRVIYAMARDRLFLAPMGRIHPRYRTPHVAIIAESAWAVLLILGADLLKDITAPGWVSSLPAWLGKPLAASIVETGTKPLFDTLTDYVVFGQFIFYLLTVLAVFMLRRSRPEMTRPYRTFGYPWLPMIFVLGSTGFLLGKLLTSPIDSIIGLVFIGCGVIAFQFRPRTERTT